MQNNKRIQEINCKIALLCDRNRELEQERKENLKEILRLSQEQKALQVLR